MFCGKCGTPLQPSVRIQTDALGGTATGERRHLTVLFCDLVNSTGIASQLDPEEWREIVAGYHHSAAEAIERFGGHVAQYLGDGVMAYFGWPEAYDNNAERAAHAGLAILEALSQLNEAFTRPKLSARVGIDSGPVVVGAGSGKNAEVFGDTPNIAARVQAAAPPGTVLMTADTHRLLSGLFVVEDYGKQSLKGLDRQIQLYRVIQPAEVCGRLQAAAAAGALTSFVGRDDELRLLMDCWEHALAGEGQVVLISGEEVSANPAWCIIFTSKLPADHTTGPRGRPRRFSSTRPFTRSQEYCRSCWRRRATRQDEQARLRRRGQAQPGHWGPMDQMAIQETERFWKTKSNSGG